MVKKILFLIILFYLLVLLQTSFLVHFSIFGIVPNLMVVLVILWNIFEKQEKQLGLANALIGGIFLDIFSSGLFGFYIFILLIISVFIKFYLKKICLFSVS